MSGTEPGAAGAAGRTTGRRTVRHAVRAAIRIAIAVTIGSLALGGVAFAASTLHQAYGAPHIGTDTQAWALRSPTYSRSACLACHADAATAVGSAAHAGVLCEACHTPTVAHPGTVRGVVSHLPVLTSALCVTCHGTTAGRQPGFPQIDPEAHYAGASCLSCHDPHTAVATRPPEVTHPLADLPACTVCHATGGLAPWPTDHRPDRDEVCLTCHRPGAGSR